MELGFGEAQAGYTSRSQIARSDTEAWTAKSLYCPNCGNPSLTQFTANAPVADFYCSECSDQFELKSQSRKLSRKLANGAYATKIERLESDTSPNFVVMRYDQERRTVEDLLIIPKVFFTPTAVEKREPLGPKARRAGCVGSNTRLDPIPQSGRIPIVQSGLICDRDTVLSQWKKIKFLESKGQHIRGWLVHVMRCVDKCATPQFTLHDIYSYEEFLSSLFPENNNVKAKIRQQLQVLRDNGYISFLGNGKYLRN